MNGDEQKEVEIKGVRPRISLSRFFSQNSRNKMDRKHQQQRKATPRLDRTIAKKYTTNDDDDEDSSSLPEEEDYYSILKIYSRDVLPSYYADPTSFRIGGSDGGEIDRICSSLGLSYLEDFAISPSDWKESEVVGDGGSGGGIKGVQRPLLDPPPSVSLPVLDNSGSTWSWTEGTFLGTGPYGTVYENRESEKKKGLQESSMYDVSNDADRAKWLARDLECSIDDGKMLSVNKENYFSDFMS
ncbi:uncharacterized protein LOC113278004 [Papaver somniferum]|uniref:uncharacterized protein LOC113278004 n=1 Tax=Papaver somniferum TaxID=3469 RepID=UPI000E6FA7BF|nr:uncharacterized protein LOC113278004 [Papaver somniferum]